MTSFSMVWIFSGETSTTRRRLRRSWKRSAVHQTLDAFEEGLVDDDPGIAPSMMYARAALKEGIPFVNDAPNLTVDIPALQELSRKMKAPICGKDFKTGQTFIKTALAPAFKARMLGVSGWSSTNILGNRDSEVLDDPQSFKTKEESKLGMLDLILRPDLYPDLYKDLYHKAYLNSHVCDSSVAGTRRDRNARLAKGVGKSAHN